MASAALGVGGYTVSMPAQVLDSRRLISSAFSQVPGATLVLGFDFPIGLPRAYAEKAGIVSFLEALPLFGSGRWAHFYELAESRDQISLERPFYPRRPGGTTRDHLVKGLGVTSAVDLLRECERATSTRGNACPLFWTLGGNQVGRASIAGWREVIVPALGSLGTRLGLWPFDGDLDGLIASRDCVIAETYPAQACVQLGLPAPGRGWSKRRQSDRMRLAAQLFSWAQSHAIDLGPAASVVADGFGETSVGEDQFDAVVGLLGMLGVILGHDPEGAPPDSETRRIEGWIFGQVAGLRMR